MKAKHAKETAERSTFFSNIFTCSTSSYRLSLEFRKVFLVLDIVTVWFLLSDY